MRHEKETIEIYRKYKCGELYRSYDIFEINGMFGRTNRYDKGDFLLYDTFEEACEEVEGHYCSWTNPNRCQPGDIPETLTKEEYLKCYEEKKKAEVEKFRLSQEKNDEHQAKKIDEWEKKLSDEVWASVKHIDIKQIEVYKKTIEDFTSLISKLQSKVDYAKKELLRLEGEK